MKRLELEKLSADLLTEAKFKADCETVTITGFIKDLSQNNIPICSDQQRNSYTEYPMNSVIAAFETEDQSNKVTFLIKKDTPVRVVTMSTVTAKKCGCSAGSNVNPRVQSISIGRPSNTGAIGQGCFYDCIDEHVGHGDDPNSSGLYSHCERRCSISMPPPAHNGVAQLPRYHY